MTFKMDITSVEPYGNLKTASVLLIGHDPRLQSSQAKAKHAFFMEYLDKYPEPPSYGPYKRKYELAHAVVGYVSDLAGQKVSLDWLYVTNLCNKFLPPTHGKGTILIPKAEADKGYKDICQAIDLGNIKVIIPTSCQVSYHLCRLGFLDEKDDLITWFVDSASPKEEKQKQGVYVTKGNAPFLKICGQQFHHLGIPVVPVLHVKQWPIKPRMIRYTDPMKNASQIIGVILK